MTVDLADVRYTTGLNDDEAVAFAALTKEMNITVRFIEYMPFEGTLRLARHFSTQSLTSLFEIDNNWSTAKLVPSADLVERIRAVYPTLSKLEDPHSDTTRSWKVNAAWKGKIGFISSMSDHFCGECSRLRVGAEGGVKVGHFRSAFLSSSRLPTPFGLPHSCAVPFLHTLVAPSPVH